jgi:uncharacterized OB-fold protein
MTTYSRPLPPADPASRPHWDGAKNGALMIQQCAVCRHCRFPATRYCTVCGSTESSWIAASGLGVIESFCTFHKAYWAGFKDALPYDVIQVRLDEGVRLYSNPTGMNGRHPEIGMRVKAVFNAVTPDATLVLFAPAQEGDGKNT